MRRRKWNSKRWSLKHSEFYRRLKAALECAIKEGRNGKVRREIVSIPDEIPMNEKVSKETEEFLMGKITKELIDSLTPLEKEAVEWCYQGFQRWLRENEEKEDLRKNKGYMPIAHLVFLGAHNFQPGELAAFKSLHKKGIIWNIIPYEEMDEEDAREYEELGDDVHKIVLDDTIVAVHNLLTKTTHV